MREAFENREMSLLSPPKKISGKQISKMIIQDFAEYLAGKGLSDETIRIYLRNYKKFDAGLNGRDLDQSYVNKFLIKHTSSASRSALTNLFEFLDLKLKVPKRTGRKANKKRKSLTSQEIKILRTWLHNNKSPRYLLMFDLSYYCSLRRAEVMAIKLNDFDIKEWAENPKIACRLLIHGKGKRERYVAVPPQIVNRILDYFQEGEFDIDKRLFPFNHRKWHEVFKEAVRSTMEYNYTLHDLRRSRATEWLNKGIDIARVKNRLGHASISTTQLYINLDEEKEFEKWAKE